jgi:hypothetical protein
MIFSAPLLIANPYHEPETPHAAYPRGLYRPPAPLGKPARPGPPIFVGRVSPLAHLPPAPRRHPPASGKLALFCTATLQRRTRRHDSVIPAKAGIQTPHGGKCAPCACSRFERRLAPCLRRGDELSPKLGSFCAFTLRRPGPTGAKLGSFRIVSSVSRLRPGEIGFVLHVSILRRAASCTGATVRRPRPASFNPQSAITNPQSWAPAPKLGSFCTFHSPAEPRSTRPWPLPTYPSPPKFGFVCILPPPPALNRAQIARPRRAHVIASGAKQSQPWGWALREIAGCHAYARAGMSCRFLWHNWPSGV